MDEKNEEAQQPIRVAYDPLVISTVTIQTNDGDYIAVNESGALELRPSVDPDGSCYFINFPTPTRENGFKALRKVQGHEGDGSYLAAHNGRSLEVMAGWGHLITRLSWNKAAFKLTTEDDGSYRFMSSQGQFVTASADGEILTKETEKTDDGRFQIKVVRSVHGLDPEKQCIFTIYGHGGMYFRAPFFKETNPDGSEGDFDFKKKLAEQETFGFVLGDSPWADSGEYWTTYPIDNSSRVRLGIDPGRTDSYLFVTEQGEITFIARKRIKEELAKDDEKRNQNMVNRTEFELILHRDGKHLIRTFDGKCVYVKKVEIEDAHTKLWDSTDKSLRLAADRDEIDEKSEFQLDIVPKVDWFYYVELNQLSSIDMTENTFKIDTEIWVVREMLSSEVG